MEHVTFLYTVSRGSQCPGLHTDVILAPRGRWFSISTSCEVRLLDLGGPLLHSACPLWVAHGVDMVLLRIMVLGWSGSVLWLKNITSDLEDTETHREHGGGRPTGLC